MNDSPSAPAADGHGAVDAAGRPAPAAGGAMEARWCAENEALRRRVAELEASQTGAQRSRAAMLNVMEDAVAARRRAEEATEALRTSEKRMRLILESARDYAIFSFDLDRRVTSWNAGAQVIFGYTEEEIAGQVVDIIFIPEDRAKGDPAQEARRAAEKGRAENERWHQRKDGTRFYGSGLVQPLSDARGATIGFVKIMRDLTAQKQAEEALRRSEEQFRRAIEDAPIPVIMQAEDGQVLQISSTWTELTGYRQEDIPTFDAWLNRAYGPGAEAVRKYMEQLFLGDLPQLEVEIELTTRDGQKRCWAFSASAPGTLHDGRRFIVGMALDVTERKAAETAVRESEERVRIAVESAQMGTWEWDLPKRVVTWNDLHFKLLGMPPQPNPVPESAFFDHVHPADQAWMTERIRQSIADRTAFEGTFRIITDQGQERWINGYGKVTNQQDGQAVQMSGVMFDITAQRRAEISLRDSEERLRLVLENAREYAILSMTLDRVILSWNTGARHILGYTPEEAIGRKADFIFTPEDAAGGAPELEARTAIADGRASDERWHVRRDGQQFWGSGVMMAMHDEHGSALGLLKIFRDHTGQMRAQQALEQSRADFWEALQETERARAEAEAAGKAKDHFLAVLSHELRTPLTPVLMATRVLGRDKTLSAAARESLAMIERNIRLESHFIEDLLDLTRIERGKLEISCTPVHLHEIVRRAVEVVQLDLEAKEQRVELSLESGEDGVFGDASRLQQVFWNLLKNASKFAPAGTTIRLRSSNEPGASGEPPSILVQVTDEGIGFETEAAERIFDAFAQASNDITREFGGLGLGLSISRACVLAHGGTIRAVSAGRNRGATFTVQLPLR